MAAEYQSSFLGSASEIVMNLIHIMKGFVVWVCLLGTSTSVAQDTEKERSIASQDRIGAIACGPCSLFNWLSHGNADLQAILKELSNNRTPARTVEHLIETYGSRTSATKPGVSRYGPHNGGVGSVNLMIMAREILSDHLDSPPNLRGEYLQRREQETGQQHLKRVAGWFADSINRGIPVLFYIRSYRRTDRPGMPSMVFGHHIVITEVDSELTKSRSGAQRLGFRFVDPSGGRRGRAFLFVAPQDFTAPTFTYRLQAGAASQTTRIQTGRPLLEVYRPDYDSIESVKKNIVVAHFATFAAD